MNSETVYQVAKALPLEEQLLLFEKLKKDYGLTENKRETVFKNKMLTKSSAIDYLIKNIFRKK